MCSTYKDQGAGIQEKYWDFPASKKNPFIFHEQFLNHTNNCIFMPQPNRREHPCVIDMAINKGHTHNFYVGLILQ